MDNSTDEEFNLIGKALTDDLHEIVRIRGTPPSACMRRLYMRTLFTSFEGRLYALKQFILSLEQSLLPWKLPRGTGHVVLFTDEQRAMLKEFTYKLTSGGEAQIATYYPKFSDSFKFTMNVLHKVMRLKSNVDYGGQGWHAVIESQKIRNRLTHPKSSADLVVTDDELKTADMATSALKSRCRPVFPLSGWNFFGFRGWVVAGGLGGAGSSGGSSTGMITAAKPVSISRSHSSICNSK